jgi:hypothetical protein
MRELVVQAKRLDSKALTHVLGIMKEITGKK